MPRELEALTSPGVLLIAAALALGGVLISALILGRRRRRASDPYRGLHLVGVKHRRAERARLLTRYWASLSRSRNARAALAVLALTTVLAVAAPYLRPVDYPKARNQLVKGVVNHYRDGDTFEVRGMPIRLASLDCAEMNTAEGARAKWAVMELTKGKPLSCQLTGDMSYDRWIGTCRLPDGRTVSRAMVQGGYCSFYRVPNFRPVSVDRLLGR